MTWVWNYGSLVKCIINYRWNNPRRFIVFVSVFHRLSLTWVAQCTALCWHQGPCHPWAPSPLNLGWNSPSSWRPTMLLTSPRSVVVPMSLRLWQHWNLWMTFLTKCIFSECLMCLKCFLLNLIRCLWFMIWTSIEILMLKPTSQKVSISLSQNEVQVFEWLIRMGK